MQRPCENCVYNLNPKSEEPCQSCLAEKIKYKRFEKAKKKLKIPDNFTKMIDSD